MTEELSATNEQTTVNVYQQKAWWLEIIQRQGLSVFIIVAGVIYAVQSFLPWTERTMTDLITWHKETVNRLQENSDTQVETNRELVQQQKILAQALEENAHATKKVSEEQVPILREIKEGITDLNEKVKTLENTKPRG